MAQAVKVTPVGLYPIGEDLHCGARRQNMNVDFYKKRLQQYRSYLQVSSNTHSHTFYQILGKIVAADLRKLGNSPKIPRRISREWLEIRRLNFENSSRTSIPTCGIFFRIFGQGVEERGRFQFSKKSAGGKRLTSCRVPLHKTSNFSTEYIRKKARKCSSGAEIFIFYLGELRWPPKFTPFLG